MSGVYLTWLATELRAAGLAVVEYDGWKTRARSSGGFADGRPLGVWWHHTASSTDPASDANYMCNGSDNKPIANVLIARNGEVWVLAAGATNTNGKGNPVTLSRGTVPQDSANSYVFGMEIANNGVGEQYPQAQVDAAFKVSNVVNAHMGNLPSDVCTHEHYAPTRKIDPAGPVSGVWTPQFCTSSNTWSVPSVADECQRRSGSSPSPMPPDPGDDDVEKWCVRDVDGWPWVTDFASYATSITEDQAARGRDMRGYLVGSDGGPFPIDQQDTDLLHRIAGS